MRLDVGCGRNKRFDIGVDLYPGMADVRASAEELPFKAGAFTDSLSSHVIEHVKNPFRMIAEMRRVTQGRIILEFPKPEYGDALKWGVHTYLLQLPFSLIDVRATTTLLGHLHRIQTQNPQTYHRWIIHPKHLKPIATIEDGSRSIQPLQFLTQGRKARIFRALTKTRKVTGLRILL